MDFTPSLKTDVAWEAGFPNGISIQRAEVVAKGTLSLNAKAIYNFSAESEYSKDVAFDVLERKWSSAYPIAPGIFVYQDVTFTLGAHIEAKANSTIVANAEAYIERSIEIGVRFNVSTNAWESISVLNGSESLTADLSIKGGVNSEIRFIPNIEVKFYKVIAADLSFEPFISSDIQAESVTNSDLLAGSFPPGITQLTVFNSSLRAECFVGANIQTIVRDFDILDKTQVCDVSPYIFFSLPEIALSSIKTSDGFFELSADITDGISNPFRNSSIRWVLYPEDSGVLQGNDREATFKFNPGKVNASIFFSGNGPPVSG